MPPFPVVLFLDYDGVLHPVGGVPARQRLARLPLLEGLLREPALARVGIVISSTWRVVHTAAQLRSQFAPDLRERVLGCTPQLGRFATRHTRHEEIAAWLAAHPLTRAWVALDDDVRGFPREAHDNAVFTDSQAALTADILPALRARLLRALREASSDAGPPPRNDTDTGGTAP